MTTRKAENTKRSQKPQEIAGVWKKQHPTTGARHTLIPNPQNAKTNPLPGIAEKCPERFAKDLERHDYVR